jgi:tetratricopeptide (TPR) repeat protein
METWHISADLMRRFIDRATNKQESMQLVRHLLRGCEQCSALTQRVLEEHGYWGFLKRAAGFRSEEYDQAFETALRFATHEQRRLALSRLRGWGQWASLDPLGPEERLPIVIGDKHCHHWGLYKALLDASLWYSRSDAREAADIVSLAIAVAELLDPASVGGKEAAIDLQAMAWAILGNARRLGSDLEGAREALNEAWRLNELGTGDPLEKAAIISFDASYVRTMGEFETAESILGEALTIYLAAQDFHMQGRILLQMGDAIGHLDPERGIAHVRHALELINTSREPRLELCAQHDLAWFLNDAGRSDEALAVLDRARRLYKQFPDEWTQLRLQWIQGRIARGMGQLGEALCIFQQVSEEFRVRDLNYDLLMVSIDLAETMVASGERDSAARLVAEFQPIMANWKLHRHALAAWLVFQQAIEEQQLEGLFTRIRLYYRRTWHKPAEFVRE